MSNETIVELRERQQKHVADAREALESIDDANEARAKELEEQHDRAMAEFDRLESKIERLQKLESAEDRADQGDPRRPIPPDGEDRGGREAEITAEEVFERAMRYGVEALSTEERHKFAELRAQVSPEMRAQAAGTDASGGYTVPQGFQAEIVRSMQAFGPMLDPGVTRELVTGAGNQIDWPTMDDTSNKGAPLSENTQASEQDVTFGQKQLDAYTYTSKIVRVSLQLLQDSAFDMNGLLRDVFGERIGRIANEHLTTGTGSGQPNGIVTASTEGNQAASAASIDFDDVIDLYHGVDPAYRALPSTRFMFHDNVLQALRKLKDGNSNYIWQPADVRSQQPPTILGEPYVVNQDMSSTITADDKTILFGAFEKYVVRRVQDFQLLRLVERYADFLQVGFIGFARIDGELVDTSAVKHLVQAPS